ncbi:MAG: VOC family protein [Woeseiaceae bacterium]|nr:VOC family protein [Woeseiaceae bacterium]
MRLDRIAALISIFGLAACGQDAPPPAASPSAPDAEVEIANPMAELGTTASNVFFYYADLEGATTFYTELLGLRLVADYGYAKILQVAPKSFLTLVDAAEGMHDADEPKTTAIALVTDQLDAWWGYVQTLDIDMRSTSYEPDLSEPHDGFVAIDPEGYFLEFERFNPHPENERFIPLLDETDTLYPEPGASRVPEGLGFKATVVWFYYRDIPAMQAFYEDVLGVDMIVDQGWTKIYRIGPTGYFGLVDETRGMHSFTEEKGVTLSLITDDIDGWFDYLSGRGDIEMRHTEVQEDERYRAFVAYDPEGYYLEWDTFTDVEVNAALVDALRAP